MNNEIRFVGHRIDLVDRGLQRGRDIRICRLVKADVAVADLHKAEVRAFAGVFAATFGECPRYRNAATHRPYQPGTCPCHALQKSATVDAIVVEVLQSLVNQILFFVRHLSLRKL